MFRTFQTYYKKLTHLLILLFIPLFSFGQLPKGDLNEWIILADSRHWLQLAKQNNLYKKVTPLSNSIPLFLLYTNQTQNVESILQQDSRVLLFQQNARIKLRSITPDDPLYSTQWAHDTIKVADAWEFSKGGLSNDNDTIVCAVIDGSFDVNHEDLKKNIWHNNAEIPDNMIDDDNNGYIDDFEGWQLVYDNDQHNYGNLSNHGTSVLGIIGAEGNNSVGVSGINQSTQLMLLSAHTGSEITKLSNIVEGFSYLYEMRKKYNESNGQEGAFVVAANGSWGINRAQPQDHPVWCALYDSLGSVGILSVAATTNNDENIDIYGDMPCGCRSEYLITVGESTLNDGIDGGYGSIALDLFAPAATKTTRWANNYGDFGGTSGAAPHVSGAIALMYSYKQIGLMSMTKQNPSKAALLIKSILLNSTDKKQHFENSVSGGRLNIGAAMQQLVEYFTVPETTQIRSLYPNPVDDMIHIKAAFKSPGNHKLNLFDMRGRLVKTLILSNNAPTIAYWKFDLSDLEKGIYILYFENGNSAQSLRFIKR